MADDLGFGDIGWFGNPIVETENIDRLAFEGQTLTQHYSAAPVCMPSRVGFFYGIYPYRTGGRMSKDGKESSLNFTCFPSLLREAGYSTCVAGKWHVGNFPKGVKKNRF